MVMMRMMWNMAMNEERQIQFFGRKIHPMPYFYTEFIHSSRGGYPKGIDKTWAKGYLLQAYEQSSCLPHMFEPYYKSDEYQPTAKDLLRRIGTNDPVKIKWYTQSNPGNIYQKQQTQPYCHFFDIVLVTKLIERNDYAKELHMWQLVLWILVSF
jgi:hypothetical protein